MSDETRLFFNGIRGDGDYDVPPMTDQQLADFIQGTSPPENLDELRQRFRSERETHLGVKEGVDAEKLDEAGWGLVLGAGLDPTVEEALSELIALRQAEAGGHFRLYKSADSPQPDESKTAWLARHGMGPGPADPEKVPYYLLLVGDPEAIPYRFQTQLDVQYSVGRIHFETLDDYARYARSVKMAAEGEVQLARRAAFFGPANPNDRSTHLSATHLVEALLNELKARDAHRDWDFQAALRTEAVKDRLAALLGGGETPAVLFTASHGMSFPLGSPRQLAHQGALLCQDWPGPEQWQQDIPERFYLAGDHLASDANLLGLIGFFFACFGAGTPLLDEFTRQTGGQQRAIAPRPFLARLPQRMLALGALAVIGHVERAWGYSFIWPGAKRQTEVFRSTLSLLLNGGRVGPAIEYFNERYAELSTVLNDELEKVDFGKSPDAKLLAGLWTANNDARGYLLLGDPAVKVPVAEEGAAARERPSVEVGSVTAGSDVATTRAPVQVQTDYTPTATGARISVKTETREGALLASSTVTVSEDGEATLSDEQISPTTTAAVTALHRAAVQGAIAAWAAAEETDGVS
ncbi:MAG: hypothetical protein R3300_10790 [Candidatus Promineifilaceae bacterium]|nr:hypothetical protein [Candidatus Promineifilaceae bacterium]